MANNEANKRPCPSPVADTSRPNLSDNLDQVHALLDKSLETHSESTKAFVGKLMDQFSTHMEENNSRASEAFKTSLLQLGGRVTALEEHNQVQLAVNAKFEKQIAELLQRTALLENQPRIANSKNLASMQDVQSDSFDRPANLSVLKVNANRYISKRAVEDALAPWLAEVKITQDQWELEGKSPQGRFFTVKFNLNPLSAARATQDALGNLRDSGGEWRCIEAKLVNEQTEKLHIGADENEKARTKRRMAACVKKAIGELYKLDNVHFKPYKEAVYADKTGICFLNPTSKDVTRDMFLWNNEALPELHINKHALLDKIMQLLERPGRSIPWSL